MGERIIRSDAIYIAEIAKLFHVSSDYLLGLDTGEHIDRSYLTGQEVGIIYNLTSRNAES